MDDEEEVSPAARGFTGGFTWTEFDDVIATQSEKKHKIVTSEQPIPNEFTIRFKINNCEQPAMCMFGLSDKVQVINGKSYLGESDRGVVGFCFSNVTNKENNWEWHNTKVESGDIVEFRGNKKTFDIYAADTKRQTITLTKEYEELYLACHLYGVCEFEIDSVLDSC
jgi:hypothetical protein